jgi:iron(III) transport system substrate-binding protein
MARLGAQVTCIDRRAFLTATAGLALTPPAFATEETIDSKLIEAAQKERSGALYTNFDPVSINEMMALFKQRFGIDVEVTRMTSGPIAQRFAAEIESGNFIADVFLTTDTLFVETSWKKGWFAPLDDVQGLNKLPVGAKTNHSLIVGYVPYSLAWDTNQVTESLGDWRTLADPKWKDRLLLVDPRRVSPATTAWFLLLANTYGDDFVRAIGKQATFAVGVTPGLQQVAAGAKALYAPAVHQVVVSLLQKGAPIGEAFPQPTVSTDNIVAISAKAPHPSIARLIVSFMTNAESQAVLNRDGFSPLTDVPGTRPLPKLAPFDSNAVQKEMPRLVALLGLS